MTREEAIRCFEKLLLHVDTNAVMGIDTTEAINMAIKALEQPEQRWIPCSERLPEEGCEFLCCDERGESIIGLPYADEEAYTGFSAESETEYIFNCVAWMPLPESYKESNGWATTEEMSGWIKEESK